MKCIYYVTYTIKHGLSTPPPLSFLPLSLSLQLDNKVHITPLVLKRDTVSQDIYCSVTAVGIGCINHYHIWNDYNIGPHFLSHPLPPFHLIHMIIIIIITIIIM